MPVTMFVLPVAWARADCPSKARGGLLGGLDRSETGLAYAHGEARLGGLFDEEDRPVGSGVRRGAIVAVEGAS
jgi:hypothetical protein